MKNIFLKSNLCLLIVTTLFCFSCSKDDSSSNPQEISSADVKSVLEADNVAKSVDNILAEVFMDNTGERKASKRSSICYESTFNETTFSLSFDNCTVKDEILNGKITVINTSQGDNISFTATFDGFSAGGIEINGTRNFIFNGDINQETYSFSVASDLAVTLEDSSILKINGTVNFAFVVGDSFETSTYTIGGNWTVQIEEDTYSVKVNDTLEGNSACDYITKGNMALAKNGLVVNVDFGDNTCDNKVTVTYPDRTTEEITLNN